ncbi:hypothetical protein AGABI2DRAFT_118483 [Agaricus bisporus var. bisporus H97]|uniref:hypothetical protein n=1 Tax=Agaricus bisporus var. bisporus (strain H97 / ATCC MYA-4626 / FGSC 10389) TaxID=936046 RepID=UPI00029F5638|nr:hypothetical protein AGABI2DRAFT_118483 [Agaricus bisporus var. bisporus H97]EKV46289.1 hypothetical protein AGABI2DRAFT_118483 [Agaricus bisporus var. bisporus H97]
MVKTTTPGAKSTASRPPSRRHIALMQPMARGRYNLCRMSSSRVEHHNGQNEEKENEEEDEETQDEDEGVRVEKTEEMKAEEDGDDVEKAEEAEAVKNEEEPMVEETHEEAMVDVAAAEEDEDEDEDDRAILALVRQIVREDPDVFVEENAMPCLRDLARRFLERYFANGAVLMRHARRRTLRVCDLRGGLHHGNPYMTHDYIPDIIAKHDPEQ